MEHKFKITCIRDFGYIIYRVTEYFRQLPKYGLTIKVSVDKPKRSNKQNAYYHTVVKKHVAEYYAENQADFLGDLINAMQAEITEEFIHELLKLMFLHGKSTTNNNTEKMEEYILAIREHFFHKYGLDIPQPNQEALQCIIEDNSTK